MKQTNVKIKADWTGFERRAPWCSVTSRELSKILGVSLQTINNWKMRDILPAPEPSHLHKGNVNRYKISKIKSWLEGKDEETIQWEWIDKYAKENPPFKSLEQAHYVIRVCHKIYEVEKPLV